MKVWKFIRQKLAASPGVVLMYVLQSAGSSPGRQGFKMAVAGDGSLCGSIGGGIMEHKFAELAKNILQQGSEYKSVYRQYHSKHVSADQSGMICSGEQIIFLYLFKEQDIPELDNLIGSLQGNRNGTLRLTNNEFSFSDKLPDINFHLEINSQDEFVYREKTGYTNKIFIIDGGHCALALSKIMRGMDFYITLIEERELLNTLEENSFVQEKKVMTGYADLAHADIDFAGSYIVIMTSGYRTDMVALRALINRRAMYIGLLGSKKKVEKIFEDIDFADISGEQRSTVHSPIGIQIKSETPEEIAVSIAAEIISIKNNQ